MTSMKIVQFSRPPAPLVHLRLKFLHPLTLDAQFEPNPPSLSPDDNQSIKGQHNPRMTILCYQVMSSS